MKNHKFGIPSFILSSCALVMVMLVRAEFTIFYPKVSYGISRFFSVFDFSKQYEGISLIPTPFYQVDDFQVLLFITLSIIFCLVATLFSILAISKRQHTALAAAGAFISVLTLAELKIYLSMALILVTIISIYLVQKNLRYEA